MKQPKFDKQQLLDMYAKMFRIREFENQVFELYKLGLMPGLAHLYIGEEAVAVGACETLEDKDYIASTHRGHGHLIARGADTKLMMAEILGKKSGYCGGKGGSMHIVAFDKGILGANGIVGAGIPIATGAAYQSKVRKTGQVTLSFFGDAASNQGTFHESLNMAAAWKLPIVYIIENNLYGISVNINRVTAVDNLSQRAQAYGIPGKTIDGNNVFEVYTAVQEAVDRARQGGGPTLVECLTYRWRGHHVGDPAVEYRTREEEKQWKEKCPLKTMVEKITQKGAVSREEVKQVEAAVVAEIAEAVAFARESPYPDAAEAFEDVFAQGGESA